MSKYYEVKREARKRVLVVFNRIKVAKDKAWDWTIAQGAVAYVTNRGFFGGQDVIGLRFPEGFTPDPQWRLHYNRSHRSHDSWYSPNRSTKAGKALDKILVGLKIPGAGEIATAVHLSCMVGGNALSISTPGIHVWGPRKRVFLEVNSELTPKDEDCTRISDLQFEKLEAQYESKKKPKRKKKKK